MMKWFFWGLTLFWILTAMVMAFVPMGMEPAMYMMLIGMMAHSIVCALHAK
ncbi:hypothetical protein [Fructilactobacillus florum]|uniref:hypothetical protein n=1 Tax=Fructilactobacillus florum TaxID=640331 RepID=UPI000AC07821|nr:hypothetical protein [Fructilactobacillus florum]